MANVTIKFSHADWANTETPDKAYAHMAELRAQGVPWKQIKGLTGVGYASGWLFEQRAAMPAEDRVSIDPTNPDEAVRLIREMRLVQGDSWGRIMARTGLPEGQVRACFTEATGVQSEGLRNGRGGRFLQGNAEAYAPAPKVGWVRKADAEAALPAEIVAGLIAAGAVEGADVEELDSLSLKALRGMAKSFGLPVAGSKAALVARLAEAYAQA